MHELFGRVIGADGAAVDGDRGVLVQPGRLREWAGCNIDGGGRILDQRGSVLNSIAVILCDLCPVCREPILSST